MVRDPLSYKYSSYADFVSGRNNDKSNGSVLNKLVDTSRVLRCFRNNPSEQYRMFVEGKKCCAFTTSLHAGHHDYSLINHFTLGKEIIMDKLYERTGENLHSPPRMCRCDMIKDQMMSANNVIGRKMQFFARIS